MRNLGIGVWRAGNHKGGVYRYEDNLHKHRMGCCDWLPQDGDLCVCISHAGDCFDDYLAIRKQDDGKYSAVGEFGAYAFGDIICTLPKRDFHLLQAGESISIED